MLLRRQGVIFPLVDVLHHPRKSDKQVKQNTQQIGDDEDQNRHQKNNDQTSDEVSTQFSRTPTITLNCRHRTSSEQSGRIKYEILPTGKDSTGDEVVTVHTVDVNTRNDVIFFFPTTIHGVVEVSGVRVNVSNGHFQLLKSLDAFIVP